MDKINIISKLLCLDYTPFNKIIKFNKLNFIFFLLFAVPEKIAGAGVGNLPKEHLQ